MNSFLALILLSISFTVIAGEKLLKSETFSNTVEDVQFEVRVQHKELLYEFMEGKPSYIAKMVAKVQVQDSKDLSQYGVVQFIRGCLFKAKKNDDGSMNYWIDTVRDFFNSSIPFKHPEWVIDSVDRDPLYWSGDDKVGRLGLYRLDDPMFTPKPGDKKFFYKDFTDQKQFYARDMPSGASEHYNGFMNSSLEFRTCLYRVSDLPREIDPDGAEILGKELTCASWQSHFIYNHEQKKFVMEKSMHPYCVTP